MIRERDLGVGPKAVKKRLDRLAEAAPAAWDRLLELPELKSQNEMIESIRSGWQGRMRQLTGG